MLIVNIVVVLLQQILFKVIKLNAPSFQCPVPIGVGTIAREKRWSDICQFALRVLSLVPIEKLAAGGRVTCPCWRSISRRPP